MAVDWNNPATSQSHSDELAAHKGRDESVAIMDFSGDSNIPDKSKRINTGNKNEIEEWDAGNSNWNVIIPGFSAMSQAVADALAGLSSSEIQQLQKVNNVSISNTQWGYIGGLSSAPLETANLAANGGTIPQNNVSETISSSWNFTGGLNKNGSTVLADTSETVSSAWTVNAEWDFNSLTINGAASQGTGTINASNGVFDANNRVARQPTGSSDPGLAFDTWRTPNSTFATDVSVRAFAETDGSSAGFINLEVDESGGTTYDYILRVAFADAGLGSGGLGDSTTSTVIPPGASYRVTNQSDPNNGNTTGAIRETTR